MRRIHSIATAAGIALLALASGARAGEPLVKDVVDIRSRTYRGQPLKNGIMVYTDRRFPMDDVPEAMVGATYLRFPNDFKKARAGGATFKLARPATVYLCFDGRAEAFPAWIEQMEFVRTKMKMTVGAAAEYPFFVFAREYPAGTVTLGPNNDENGQGGGCIIDIASTEAYRASVTNPAYSSAKAGLLNLVMSLACEWAQYNIRVNAIAPGFIDHPYLEYAMQIPHLKAIFERIPLKRGVKPDEIGATAVYLASDAAAYVTGTTIPLDGGMISQM